VKLNQARKNGAKYFSGRKSKCFRFDVLEDVSQQNFDLRVRQVKDFKGSIQA
jgi:hypothetical protein